MVACLALACLLTVSVSYAIEPPTVHIPTQGRVVGTLEPVPPPIHHIDLIASFKGIPYAVPPVGSLRWKPPSPHTGWDDTHTFNASSYGRSCPNSHKLFGSVAEQQSEDCLFLNVWTVVEDDGHTLKQGLPVVVMLHGGAFAVGSGSHPKVAADPQTVVPHHNCVYVSLNYRLGVLGFMSHPGMDTVGGAFGMQDQILALQWVQHNIAAFGGDPQRVTLQGGSAGAMSIHHLMVMPASKGLFSGGIMQSPLGAMPYQRLPEAHAQARFLASKFGCDRPNDADAELACMAQVDPLKLVTKVPIRRGMVFYDGLVWMPVVNGEDIPEHPFIMVKQGQVHPNLRIVLGTMRDEMSLFLFLAFPMYFRLEWAEDVLASVNPEHAHTLMDVYRSDRRTDETDFQLGARAMSDMWTCSNKRFAEALAPHVDALHVYQFNHVPTYLADAWPLNLLGVFHGLEMTFTHGTNAATMPAADLVTVNHVMSLWRSFINGEDVSHVWPVFSPDGAPSVLSFQDGDQVVVPGYPDNVCPLWDQSFDDEGLVRDTKVTPEPLLSWLLNVVVYRALTRHIVPTVAPVLSASVWQAIRYVVPFLAGLYLVTGLRPGLVKSSSAPSSGASKPKEY